MGGSGVPPSKLGRTQLQALNQVQASVSLESTFPSMSSLVLEPPSLPSNLPLMPAPAPTARPSSVSTGLSVTLAFAALYQRTPKVISDLMSCLLSFGKNDSWAILNDSLACLRDYPTTVFTEEGKLILSLPALEPLAELESR